MFEKWNLLHKRKVELHSYLKIKENSKFYYLFNIPHVKTLNINFSADKDFQLSQPYKRVLWDYGF